MRIATALVVMAGLATASCAGQYGKLAALPDAPPGAYRLGPGDELRVTVFGLDAMNNTYIVSDTGMIALPLLAPVSVSGRTVREVEDGIGRAIAERQLVNEPRVSTQVQTYRPFYISGQVQRPGQYPYVPGMSLMTAVSIAGGYTFRADTKRAIVRRQTASGIVTPDQVLMPGDIVTVGESTF